MTRSPFPICSLNKTWWHGVPGLRPLEVTLMGDPVVCNLSFCLDNEHLGDHPQGLRLGVSWRAVLVSGTGLADLWLLEDSEAACGLPEWGRWAGEGATGALCRG